MKVILVTVLSIMFLCSGCSSNIKEEQKSIKICSSLNETMTDILAEDFAKQQNVKVEVRHLPAGNLDERLNFLREGKFDVWLGGTPEEYYLAGEQKMLRSYRPREAYKVPAEMRENQWRWTGLYVDYIGFLTNRDRLRELGLYAPETWDELLKPELWEGMAARTTNTSLGLSLLYDSRDFLTNAYRGYYLRIDQRFSPAFFGNKYAFSSTELTTSYYHPIWKGGILAGQFHTLLTYGDTPWGLMATLGSSYSMRGYYEGRYRDKCAMDAQIELRQHVWKRNGVAVWAGAGTIFPEFSAFTPKHILPNYGFGYRWEFKKRVNVRLDLGFGKHQTGFIFNINEAF
jgi:hypothetical protein